MAVTPSDIRTDFPAFTKAPDAVLSARIAEAEAMLDESTFGDDYDLAVALYACHLTALDPSGKPMRKDVDASDLDRTLYGQRVQHLMLKHGGGPMVI